MTSDKDYLFAKTQATFTNNAKRIIEYEYKLTTANIGYFQPGENGEFTIEIGLLHAVVNQYSFLKLPNNEIDFFHSGVSADNTWVNLGMDAKITYLKPLGEKWLFHFQATGIYLKNEKDIAPFITLDGHRASLSLIGISAGAGLTFKFGEYYE